MHGMSERPRSERAARSSAVLRSGLAMSDLDFEQLWSAYVGLGGSMSAGDLRDALNGQREISDHQHDMVAQALNDHFVDKGQNHPVAYSDRLHHQPDPEEAPR